MNYSFSCPIEGCQATMTVDAQNDEEALGKLVEKAKQHLAEAHTDMHKTDEEIRNDIAPHMVKEQSM